jgi:hypothetical protein
MDIKIVGEQPSEPKESPQGAVTSGGDADELLYSPIHNVMGLETDGDKQRYSEKVKTLIEYAKQQTDDHSPDEIAWIIRDLDMRLGAGPHSEERINHVANYAFLRLKREDIDKKIKRIEHS